MEMMMAFRKFEIPQSTETIGFELAGEKFICRPQIAAGVLLRLGMATGSEVKAGAESKQLGMILSFFKTAIMQPGYDKFMAMLDDEELAIPMSVLVDIAEYLGEQYSGERPTGESLPNSSAKLSTGDDLTVGVSVETPTYSRSLPTELSTSSSSG